MRTIKKTISFIIILCMMLTGIFMQTAYARNNDYPYKYRDTSKTDEWNFSGSSCASFVAWRLNNANGIAFNSNFGGKDWAEVKSWGNNAKELGIVVDNNPTVGSIAWWDVDNSSLLLKYRDKGHVAWVEAVNGSNVTVEEYNYKFMSAYSDRVITANEPNGYIHFKNPEGSTSENSQTTDNKQDQTKQEQGKQNTDKQNTNNTGKNDDGKQNPDKSDKKDNLSGAEVIPINPNIKSSRSKYSVKITEDDVAEGLDSADDIMAMSVELSSITDNFNSLTLSMTADAFEAMVDGDIQSFQINLAKNIVYIDGEALEEIAEKADGKKVVITIKKTTPKSISKKNNSKDSDNIYALDIKAGRKRIRKLSNGRITAENVVNNLSKSELRKHLLWIR